MDFQKFRFLQEILVSTFSFYLKILKQFNWLDFSKFLTNFASLLHEPIRSLSKKKKLNKKEISFFLFFLDTLIISSISIISRFRVVRYFFSKSFPCNCYPRLKVVPRATLIERVTRSWQEVKDLSRSLREKKKKERKEKIARPVRRMAGRHVRRSTREKSIVEWFRAPRFRFILF